MKFVLILVFLIVGCDALKSPPTPPREKIVNYKCQPSQIADVDKLFKVCNESQYTSSYCYLSSVASICEYVGEK